jgi:superfamily II DNA or RNA helicase
LALLLFEGDAQPCAGVRVIEDETSATVRSLAGATLLRVLRRDEAAERLLARCLPPAEDATSAASRARLLGRLRLLQLTPQEQAINDAGMKTQRQAFEESFWYRVGYHCFREHGDGRHALRPEIDAESGEFCLAFCPEAEGPRALRIVVPRARVEAALHFLEGELPDDPACALRPIPLRSLFHATPATTLDLPVRAALEALQAQGEARVLVRPGLERFRYGDLVYLEELAVLAALERPGSTRKFAAPRFLELARCRVPTFSDRENATRAATEDAGGETGRRTFRDFDWLQLTAHRAERGALWISARCGFGRSVLPLAELLQARAERRPHVEIEEGWIDLTAPPFAALEATALEGSEGGPLRASARDLLRLAATTRVPITVAAGGSGSAILERLLALQPSQVRPSPEGLRSALRAYQKIGLDWLLFLYENGLGGLLCDDMGLGKTHQAMGLMVALREQLGRPGPFLVVAPTSVVSHWRDKIRDHAPGLHSHLHHGRERSLPAEFPPGSVLLTSYGVLRNDLERLQQIAFDVAVVDEVQQVKNRQTQGHRAVAELQAGMKLGLTGTPIENDLGDLKALFDLVLPGYLGSDRRFLERYGTREPGPLACGIPELQRAIAPFLLRRVKSAVLHELPDKIEDVRACALSEEQRDLYHDAMTAKAGPLVEALADESAPVPYLHVFALLNRLKQICDHPALVRGRTAEYEKHASGKWELFVEVLAESLDSGQKVVVFTQFLGMIAIMEAHLRAIGVGFATLTGASTERGALVDRFNRDPACRVFLGSLKAGGTGIDLVGGSVVIHYDRWWNAAREDQATDRVHRIGQRRAVQVFKLVTEATVEERIAAIIDRKRRLADDVLQADDPHLAKIFTREELIRILG